MRSEREILSCTMNPAQRPDFVVSRRGMKWASGDPVEVTDEDPNSFIHIECSGLGLGINCVGP